MVPMRVQENVEAPRELWGRARHSVRAVFIGSKLGAHRSGAPYLHLFMVLMRLQENVEFAIYLK